MRGGVLTGRVFTAVNAGSWDGLVYSINGTSGDANGNVNVPTVNGHTVNSDVPASADFAQYDQNTADIAAIENSLSGLTATASNVTSGQTFVGSDGVIATGTMVNNGAVSESLAIGETYTIPAGYHNGSGTVTAPSEGTVKITSESIWAGYANCRNSCTLTRSGTISQSGLCDITTIRRGSPSLQ